MSIRLTPTPYRTVHITGTDHSSHERGLKAAITRTAKTAGLGERLTRRSHVVGNQVTVFDIYRKA